jgi:FAD/FMN-containing dehydrogenase
MLNNLEVQPLADSFHGHLIRPVDPEYDEARALWNGMIDKKPVLIARCQGVVDVVNAVNFAREQGLTVAVRAGGHNVAGLASADDSIMIDLSKMRAVYVDPKTRTARVEGGATWGDVDRETQLFGLATPGGIISTTGVAGLTLGGGFGWLSRKHGLTADNLLSADVVTAGGELLKASSTEHPDLFWAIRGGGGNFGIVTSFEFQLHELGPEVLYGPTVYRLEDAPEVLRHYREFMRTAPNECTAYLDFLTAPPLPFLPEEIHGTKVLSVIQLYAGSVAKGEELLRPLREFGNPVGDGVAPTPYATAQSIVDPLYAKGASNYWKSHNLTALSGEIIDTLIGCAMKLPTPQSDILIHQLGGAINDLAPDAISYPHRNIEFIATPGGRWEDRTKGEAYIAWVRECHDALAEHAATGVYVNFLSHDESEDRLRAAYGDNAERLRKIKAKYDPDNFFHVNQNIEPAGGA